MNFLVAPIVILLLSVVITSAIAAFKKLTWWKWAIVGLLLPFFSIFLALFFPKKQTCDDQTQSH